MDEESDQVKNISLDDGVSVSQLTPTSSSTATTPKPTSVLRDPSNEASSSTSTSHLHNGASSGTNENDPVTANSSASAGTPTGPVNGVKKSRSSSSSSNEDTDSDATDDYTNVDPSAPLDDVLTAEAEKARGNYSEYYTNGLDEDNDMNKYQDMGDYFYTQYATNQPDGMDENSHEAQVYTTDSGAGDPGEGQQAEASNNTEFNEDMLADEADNGTFEGTPLDQMPNTWLAPINFVPMQDVKDKSHNFLIKPFAYNTAQPNVEPQPITDGTYIDEWDNEHVRMPCSDSYVNKVTPKGNEYQKRWPIIQESLTKLLSRCETKMASFEDIKNAIEECAGRTFQLTCLQKVLTQSYSDNEREHFMTTVVPNIVQLALSVGELCGRPPKLLSHRKNGSVTMSQLQAASLLSCAFFCLFPRRHLQKTGAEYEHYPNPNLNSLFMGNRWGGPSWKQEKIKCVLHYFERITKEMPNGVLTFRRRVLPQSCMPNWSKIDEPLCPIHITKNKTIEDMSGMLQVDFANKYIGGGVLGDGCVQEEIRFVICPEMLISLLLCEVLYDNEAIFLVGCERFSSYKGYSANFKYKEDYIDTTHKDSWGRKLCHVVAMDAIFYRLMSAQYSAPSMNRELLKAFTCFCVPPAISTSPIVSIATGNWGCGAFNGNKQLKAMIQLIAASASKRPLVYIAYRDPDLVHSFWEVYEYLESQKATVKDMYKYIIQFRPQSSNSTTLFDFILSTPINKLL